MTYWTTKQLKFVKEMAEEGHSAREIYYAYNEKYESKRTIESIRSRMPSNGFFYTKEQVYWLKRHMDEHPSEICDKFNRKFNSNRTVHSIRQKLYNIRLGMRKKYGDDYAERED